MDDSCAVCADALEWVAYGPCGHREVCSTCVVRLRFVLDDRRCCICKTENPAVFVTKAMGDYTRVITDFSVFPADAREGKVGGYWYHEDSQAWFDDPDHYRMVKAMCRLSCSVCAEDEGLDGRRRTKYRNIDQLKGHLFHQHKLFMCTLCLEGRKVFICEQKLYTRSQLDQHIHTGNSEVDGNESERGGFMGHPMCEFCKNPFYGDNELYMHMSTEHYTCHICQRQHPGQYDYYRNYDDLEMHFRQEHFLCEDESCLSKKFVVFQTDVEMKRHNTIEHGGQMSRSKRNAALQIPTSFRYRRNNEEEQRRGRGRGFRRDQSSNQLSMAIQASLEDNARGRASSSGARAVTDNRNVTEDDSTTGSFETSFIDSGAEQPRSAILEESSFPPLSDRELPEPSARYAQALQIARNANRLGEESFPPLPGGEKSNKPKPSLGSESLVKSTLASRLHPKNKGAALAARSSAWSRPSGNHEMDSSSSASSQTRASKNHKMSTSVSSQPPAATNNVISSSTAVSSQPWPTLSQEASPSSAATQVKPTKENVLAPPVSAHSLRNANAATRLRQSLSDPNLTEGSLSQSTPTMASAVAGNRQLFKSSQPRVEDVQTANKSLIERIRAGVGMDEDRFSAFKNVSAEYRQGQINTWEYLSYVEQFGLSHLILELARLCPDPRKQKELIDAYNANLQVKDPEENGDSDGTISRESKKKGKRGKGKGKAVEHTDNSSATGAQAESFLDTVRKLQLNMKPQEEDVESLSKDGYRAAKGKVQLSAGEASAKSSSISRNTQGQSVNMPPLANGATTTTTTTTTTTAAAASSGGMSKPQKKTSKFQRVRLGDGSLLELGRSNPSPKRMETVESSTGEGLPARGVWRNGGGTKLVANSLKNP